MYNFTIVCGSTADLSRQRYEERNVAVIPFSYIVDGVEYVDDFGTSMSYKEFYQKLRNGAVAKTSQINTQQYIDFFTPILEKGQDILYICFSSGLSGTYQSAIEAVNRLKGAFKDRKIYVVDSYIASSGYGMLVEKACDLRDSGLSVREVSEYVQIKAFRTHAIFFSSDLSSYIRGGRVGKVAGLIGSILKICPVLHVDNHGKLIPFKKVAGEKLAIKELYKTMMNLCDNGENYSDKVYISHSDCIEKATELKNLIESKFENLKDKVEIFDIGTTIGSHSGAGTVALFFFGKDRRD